MKEKMNREKYFEYLNEIYNYYKENDKDFIIEPEEIYTTLIEYGVKDYNTYVSLDLTMLARRMNDISGTNSFGETNNQRFFYSNHGIVNNATTINLYIPLKALDIGRNLYILLDFLCKNKINYRLKVYPKIGNNSVVLKVDNLEIANKIIAFINSSQLRENMSEPNPMLANVNGVGVCEGNFFSYDYKMCEILAEILNSGLTLNSLSFLETLNKKIAATSDPNLKKLYLNAKAIQESYQKKSDKFNLLLKVMNETYNRYGLKHLKNALKAYLDGNVKLFSRGSKEINYRELLVNNISPDELYSIMLEKTCTNKTIDMINKFVDQIYPYREKETPLENNKDEEILLDLIEKILAKYGEDKAAQALTYYAFRNDSGLLTDNEKDEKVKDLNHDNVLKIIKDRVGNIDNLEIACQDYIDAVKVIKSAEEMQNSFPGNNLGKIVKATIDKYGKQYARTGIWAYAKTGGIAFLSDENNYRDMLEKSIPYSKISDEMKKELHADGSLDDLIDLYVDKYSVPSLYTKMHNLSFEDEKQVYLRRCKDIVNRYPEILPSFIKTSLTNNYYCIFQENDVEEIIRSVILELYPEMKEDMNMDIVSSAEAITEYLNANKIHL